VITKTQLPNFVQPILLVLLGLSAALGLYQHIAYSDFPYGPFQELNASLRQRMEPQDVIIHANKRTMLPAMVFDPDLPHSFIGDPPGSAGDTLALATQQVLNIMAEDNIQSASNTAGRIWYIIHQRKIQELQALGYENHPDLSFLDTHYSLTSQESWNELRVFLYTKDP
jgi:hypothetical protein